MKKNIYTIYNKIFKIKIFEYLIDNNFRKSYYIDFIFI